MKKQQSIKLFSGKNQIVLNPIKVKYDNKDVIVGETMKRHEDLSKFGVSFLLTYIWGELQSGKTDFIDVLCHFMFMKYGFKVVVTTTLDDKMVNSQLWDRLKYGNVVKVVDLKKYSASKIKQVFGGATMFIVDEADFGQGEDSKFFNIVTKIINNDIKMHLVMVGATNYTAMLAQFSSKFDKANVEHFALKTPNTYFGMHQMVANGNIVDINSGDYSIDKSTGKVSKGIKDEIVKLNNLIPGFNLLRVSYQDKDTKKSILLADKVISDFESDKRFKDYIFVKIYDSKKRDLKTEFKDAQSFADLGKKVIAIVISGMRASISFWPELKTKNALRFGFEDAMVASSGAQGVAGRFNGHYYTTSKSGKKIPFIPTFKIICNTELISYYTDVWSQIKNGVISSIPDLSSGKKVTTWGNTTDSQVYPSLDAKLVWKGNWHETPYNYEYDKYSTQSKKRIDFNTNDFYNKYENMSIGDITDISKILYNITDEKVEYKKYAHVIYNNGVAKKGHLVMVYEIVDTNATNRQNKITKKVIKIKDALSKVFNG